MVSIERARERRREVSIIGFTVFEAEEQATQYALVDVFLEIHPK